jgi:UDP-2-acetamido-3-amino-2,3-dideoxy-glucuronate N-acetyltransferase
METYIDKTSIIDNDVIIGSGTKIWHFCHVMRGAHIGIGCKLGQNVFVGEDVRIGNFVSIQNNVSAYKGVCIEDNVFLGPSCVFTNVTNPRSFVDKKHQMKNTIVRFGATIGANATILCGIEIGKYALVGAGSVVTKNVPDYWIVAGNPAKKIGEVDVNAERVHEHTNP